VSSAGLVRECSSCAVEMDALRPIRERSWVRREVPDWVVVSCTRLPYGVSRWVRFGVPLELPIVAEEAVEAVELREELLMLRLLPPLVEAEEEDFCFLFIDAMWFLRRRTSLRKARIWDSRSRNRHFVDVSVRSLLLDLRLCC